MGNDPEAVKLLIAKAKVKLAELLAEKNRLTDRKKANEIKSLSEEQRRRIETLSVEINAANGLVVTSKAKLQKLLDPNKAFQKYN
jgi:hypothetical protein